MYFKKPFYSFNFNSYISGTAIWMIASKVQKCVCHIICHCEWHSQNKSVYSISAFEHARASSEYMEKFTWKMFSIYFNFSMIEKERISSKDLKLTYMLLIVKKRKKEKEMKEKVMFMIYWTLFIQLKFHCKGIFGPVLVQRQVNKHKW